MKTIPPPCPEPESGQKYWRSLDQLADTPEFHQWLEREFPAGASEIADPVTRRSFVKLMSASFLLGGMGFIGTGCRRPEEKILPFGKMPEGYIHGVPQYFATSMPTRGGAIPLLVKSHENRPTKIEGNPEHPDSNGATDTFAQAALLGLYDPDRAQRYTLAGTTGGETVPKAKAVDTLADFARQMAATRGAKVAFVMEASSSPSRQRLINLLQLTKLQDAKWAVYEPVDLSANRRVTGSAPYYKLDAAKVILSLDCDFAGSEADTHRLIRGYAKGRRTEKATDAMNRLYAVEGLMTLTGMNADHRLRVPTSQVVAVAAQIAAKIAPQNTQIAALAAKLPLPAGVKPEWITECAADLSANQGASVVLAGHRQPLAVHIVATLLNTALGNNGKTVFFSELPETRTNSTLADIARDLAAGQIETLVILGGNPALTAPADLKWAEVQKRAVVIRLGSHEDETYAATKETSLGLPQTHFLESWGDARTSDGTLVPVQPLVAPLFDGMTELEVLARLGGLDVVKPYDIVRETCRPFFGAGNFEEAWKKFLHDGYLAGATPRPGDVPVASDVIAAAFAAVAPTAPGKENLELVFHRDLKVDDGRGANNAWLQEFPDPITKITWDGVVLLSRKTAEELGVTNKDVINIEISGRQVQGPVWIQPGFADYSLGLALGYGRKRSGAGGAGRIAHDVGLYNAYELRTSGSPNFAVGAKVTKAGRTYPISCTQEHGSMEGRPIVREANKSQYEKFPKFAKNFDLDAPGTSGHIAKDPKTGRPLAIYEHPYKGMDERGGQSGVQVKGVLHSQVHQWGMSIDLSACVGCGACVLACQSENNIPVVGKDQVSRNREMHWLRIDRYWSGTMEKGAASIIDEPQAVTQPMLCQHCENAPCESVCPVNATVHDEEGVNVMAYNRCVGTRYCSNNCPYKVRRFNFFDYNKRSLDQLKGPYYSTPLTSSTDGQWDLLRWFKNPDLGTRPDDEWNLLKLIKNPDVSVRMRGVMEKCTFCQQRLEQAKIAQKVKAGASGDVQVKDGAVKTACQQACPAEAIVFGNQLDPNSRVSLAKKQDRDYDVLGFLDTRPRVTYLARVRNPNPKMPDYHKIPLNIEEYDVQQTSSAFEEHAHGSKDAHGAAGEKKGAH